MSACIQIAHLTKRYGSTVAVSDLSIEVPPGQVLGLLGPNGAGKSTTLYMLAGLVPPSSGTITIFGKELRRGFLDIASRMAVLVERPAFYEHLSARKNLMLLAMLARRNVTVDRALDMVGLLPVASKKVGALSMGMRQRLGLAQALLTEPELLLLDEPTTGLDVEATQNILTLLRRLADDAHVTIVFSSHMLHEVEALCDQVAIINQGQLVATDTTEALLSHDPSVVEVYLDTPEAASRKLIEQDWVASTRLKAGRLEVRLSDGTPAQLVAFLVGAGYKVNAAIPRRRSLQEYFLKVLNS